MIDIPGFKEIYLKDNKIPEVGNKLTFPAMSKTFSMLIKNGLEDFYLGEISESIISDLSDLGSPLRKNDFKNFNASFVNPLELKVKNAKLFNLPPPTQGLASILILGVLNELPNSYKDDVDFIHTIVEATKVVFKIRDRYVCDPKYMSQDISQFLNNDYIKNLANKINFQKAMPWPDSDIGGDTVCLLYTSDAADE